MFQRLFSQYKLHDRGIVLDLAKSQGLVTPIIISVVGKELLNQLVWRRLRVVHADASNHDSPVDTSQVSKHVRVNAAVLGPKLNHSQGQLEVGFVGNEVQDHVCDSTPVKTLNSLIVDIS